MVGVEGTHAQLAGCVREGFLLSRVVLDGTEPVSLVGWGVTRVEVRESL